MAAKLASYLGDAYALNVMAGTAALPMLDMHPLIADLLAIDATRSLTLAEVTHLLEGNRADGQPIPGKEVQASTKDKARLTFTDFTYSAPKSLSIAIALAPDDRERIVLETAFMRANNSLMKHIETEIGGARQGRGGRDGVIPGHMAVVQFHHHTARPTQKLAVGDDTRLSEDKSEIRPGDMHRHTHNLFVHVTITDDGDVKSPNLNTTKGRILEWGAVGDAFLARELWNVGVNPEIDQRTGLLRLADVPQTMDDVFSARTRQAETMARARTEGAGGDFDELNPQQRVRRAHGAAMHGRQAKEHLSAQEFWEATAAEAGYEHKPVIDLSRQRDLAPEEERARVAYEAALPLLEPELERRAKLDGPTVRYAAARGMIASGIDTPAEIEAVLSAFQTEGVRQDGRMVAMITGREHGQQISSATTSLHVSQEREAIAILRRAAEDRTAALNLDQIEAAVQRVSKAKGYDFTTPHGLLQREMIKALSTGGRAVVGIGAAGAGKTALLAGVIDAYHDAGWQSSGVTLAWRQTQGLVDAGVGEQRGPKLRPDPSALIDAGIAADRALAMAPFLKAIERGKIKLDDKTLVVIDEIATIDTQQILQLARAQNKYGFKVAGIGDPAQCVAISAGNTITLFRRALGSDQVPEIVDSIRMTRAEDRDTAKLWRQGRADLALPRKEARGLFALVPGDYHDTIKAESTGCKHAARRTPTRTIPSVSRCRRMRMSWRSAPSIGPASAPKGNCKATTGPSKPRTRPACNTICRSRSATRYGCSIGSTRPSAAASMVRSDRTARRPR